MGAWGSRYITYGNDLHVERREAALIDVQTRCGYVPFQYDADNQRTRARQVAIATAQFLHTCSGVPKCMGKAWLGRCQFPLDIMVTQEYARYLSFAGIDVDCALARYLRHTDLPCPAPYINNFIREFADAYFHDNRSLNASPFASADAIFVLAFQIFLLSINFSDDGIAPKKTEAEWISENKGLNDGKDFPDAVLTGIYARTAASPIRAGQGCTCASQ